MKSSPRTIRLVALSLTVALLATVFASTGVLVQPAAAEDEVLAFPTPEDFVVQQYQDFLARDPDPSGLAFWAGELRSGVDSARLVGVMAASPEFANTIAPVVRLYLAHLDRTPDVTGLQFWAGKLRTGTTLELISEAFARSPEFISTYGTLSDERFVDLVYRNVLDRSADGAGADFWLARLDSGMTRGALMVQFSESSEFVAKTDGVVKATMLYVGMLRRQPEPEGLSYWASVIADGTDYREVIAGFLASDEYTQRTTDMFQARQPLTGEAARTAQTRPALVLKIDNHNRARPQLGINQADIVWEELVEGGMTRFAAVFHRQSPLFVGPIRSARTGDIDLVSQLNRPLFGASGANSGVLDALSSAPLVNVNARVLSGAYYRESRRSAPHNLFAITSELWAAGGNDGGTPPTLMRYREVGAPSSGTPAQGVDIGFSLRHVSYRWNGTGWVRSQDGSIHVDSAGVPVAPPNVIVQVTKYVASAADARSPEAVTVGEGTIFVYSGGMVTEGRWSRANALDPIVYNDLQGNEILLAPGRTWFVLAPEGSISLR